MKSSPKILTYSENNEIFVRGCFLAIPCRNVAYVFLAWPYGMLEYETHWSPSEISATATTRRSSMLNALRINEPL